MNILVTGGAGYVGSHAVKRLAEHGHHVCVYDNLSRGHRWAVGENPLVVGELADRDLLLEVFREHDVDAVMHFAALAYVGESVHEPASYYTNNVGGTLALLEAMRQADVSRIVFSSTCATYGVPDRVPITEKQTQRPINPYGFTKLAMERALSDYATAYGLRYAALRYFNAAGAAADASIGEDHDPETHLIPIALEVALGKRPHLDILGTDYPTRDGTCIRDYVHVDDLADAHLAALERLADTPRLELNLGTGQGASVLEVVAACEHVSGRTIETRAMPRRDGDPPELVADPSRARSELRWQPRYTEVGPIVATAWQWMQRRHEMPG